MELGGLFFVGLAIYLVSRRVQRSRMQRELGLQAESLARSVIRNFLVQPCSRCHESMMSLLEVSPNGRSVHYQCLHCEKSMRSPAGAPASNETASLSQQFHSALAHFNTKFASRIEIGIHFSTPESPLPYERTTREPIPEAVRTEVWRRDNGRCVKCESCEQLEFDHIIPVSRGGATSVRNLQLLCKQCNLAKAASI